MKEIQNASFKLLKLSSMVMGKIKYCEDSIHIVYNTLPTYCSPRHKKQRNHLLYSQIENRGSPEFLVRVTHYEMQYNC